MNIALALGMAAILNISEVKQDMATVTISANCITAGDIKSALEQVPDNTYLMMDGDDVNDILHITYNGGLLYLEMASSECEE